LRPRQGAGARSKKFVLPFLHFLHQNETTAGWQDPDIKFSLKINSPYYTGGPLCTDGNLYPEITLFMFILSLRSVYIFEIYVKFCVFWYPSSPHCEKKLFGPLYTAWP
jgi:hypothetical protein